MKKKVKVDYYEFSDFSEKALWNHHIRTRTMFEAKREYLERLSRGHRLGGYICGHTLKDDSVFLTLCPFYSDTQTFGRTELTYIGEQAKRGDYNFY